MLTLLHSIIDRKEHEKYLFLPLYGNTEGSRMTVHSLQLMGHSKKAKGQLHFVFVLSNIF